MREVFINQGSTTLNGSITSGATSITVVSGSVFPSSGQFRVACESEVMLATARSGNVLTVVRGIEGTTAASHLDGLTIAQSLTVGGLQQYGRDNVPGFDGSRPPYQIVDSSRNVLTSSDFTTVNAATNATITDVDGSIVLLTTPAASAYAICLARSIPATKQLITALRPIIQQGGTAGFMHCFVGFRESATGKLILFGPQNYNGAFDLLVRHYDSPTSLNSTQFDEPIFMPGADAVWLKLHDDGTNLICSVGDGSNWIDVFSEARASFFTTAPDQFIFGTNASGSLNIINRLCAWQEG